MTERAAIATPATDAMLRRRYTAMGRKAATKREPRTPPCNPSSMIGGWWFEGYDFVIALDKTLNKDDD